MSFASCAVATSFFASLFALAACVHRVAPGAAVTEARALPSFARIEVRAGVRVDVHEGRAARVIVTGEGDVGRVSTRVEGETLVVDLDSAPCVGICIGTTGDARVDVDVPQLSGVTIEGSGNVFVDGASRRDAVDLVIRGSGDLHFATSGGVVRCAVEGSGDVVLRGDGELQVTVAGSGNVDARAFAAHGASVDIDGSGDVTADLHGAARVRIHGSGTLHYTGDATLDPVDVSGSGGVAKL